MLCCTQSGIQASVFDPAHGFKVFQNGKGSHQLFFRFFFFFPKRRFHFYENGMELAIDSGDQEIVTYFSKTIFSHSR